MADNLGEYKVVVSADYSNLQKSIADLLKSIQGSADDISGVFSKLTDNIEKSAVSSKAFDSVKGSIDEAKASVNALADQTKNAGSEAQSTSNKYKTLQASLREARTDAEKAFGTDAFDKARGSYDSILARMTAFKSAIGDTQEATAMAEQSTQRAIEQSIAKRKEYMSTLMATQNRQADTQYYKDIEAQQKRNSDLIKSQMQARVDAENQQKKAADEAGKAQQKALLDASKSATVYESVLSKVRGHLLWMASATITGAMFAAPFEAVKTIADVEKQMAGMIQVLPQLHGNQLALNNVSQQFITIAEQYGMEVNKIIEAGKLKLAA